MAYCNKLQKLDEKNEARKFSVNGGGANDFSVNVTKKTIQATQTYAGKAINDSVNEFVVYQIEPINIVRYNNRIYKDNSTFIKKLQSKIDRKYNKSLIEYEARLLNHRLNMPCFDMGGKMYCDGDLVTLYNITTMLRVVKSGYDTVRFFIYYYNGTKPISELYSEFYTQFRMTLPEVIGNHAFNQQKPRKEMLDNSDLRLEEIQTFKEW